ncbi:hypothetical protein [Streptomyces luteogriseus]|uniref:hypothetical protein n=1 Tax=Streptomyces luteogriseus TaxID=68233 RepID=UPI0037A144AA
MKNTPAYITVTKQSVYARYPDIDSRIIAHIEQWRDSVPVGTSMSIDKMMCCSATCGCPADTKLAKCKGSGHGMPVEIVLDLIFPEGSSCAIEGVKGISDTTPKQIMRTF